MSEWALVAVGLALTVGTGLFVASEFALVNLDRHELETRRDAGEKGLGPTIRALRITSTHLSSAQLGITLTTLLTGYTLEPAISSLLETPLDAVGVSESMVRALGGVIGVVLATLLSMVIGELVPKNFALALPAATARLVVPFQAAFTTTFKPAVVVLNNTANALIRALGVEPKEELSGARSAEELISLIRHSASEGLLEHADATLLDRTLRLADRDASDLMTPRVRMDFVRVDDVATDIISVSAHTGHSRLPVVAEGPDDVVGVVHVKQAFAVPLESRDATTAAELMSRVQRIPETVPAPALLEQLRGKGLQIAVVMDEYGGTAGVVTLEDVVEEIIGELHDEHDRQSSPLSRRGGSVIFDASWRPDEVLARTSVVVPESEDWDTVGGYLAASLGRLPEPGDEVPVEDGVLRVERVEALRVSRVQFLPTDVPGGPDDSDGQAGHDPAGDGGRP